MKVNQDRVAVDDGLRYRPMNTCPLDCKVLLLTKEGIAVLGKIKAKEALHLWDGWFPLPKRRLEE